MPMAVTCRCQDHPPRNNRLHKYTHWTHPIGYPNTSSICGRKNCRRPGLIYMTDDAVLDYNKGIRIFRLATAVAQVQVDDIKPKPI